MKLLALPRYEQFHEVGLQLNRKVVERNAAAEALAFAQLQKHHTQIQLLVAVNGDDEQPLMRVLVFYFNENPILACWGWYEALDHPMNTAAWQEVIERQHKLGAEKMMGPILGNTWFEYRYKLTAQPTFMYGEPRHSALYLKQLEHANFLPTKTFNTAISNSAKVKIKPLETLTARLTNRQLTFAYITSELEQQHLEEFHRLTTECFSDNVGFEEIDFGMYAKLMQGLGMSMDRELSIAFMHDGKPIAFLITQYINPTAKHPELPPAQTRALRTLAVSPEFRNQDLGILACDFFHTLCVQKNIHTYLYALLSRDQITDRAAVLVFRATTLSQYALFETQCRTRNH